MTTMLAYLHYVALGLGFIGVFSRGRALKHLVTDSTKNIKELFLADNVWGIAAILWIVTGLMRAFGPYEKGADFYLHTPWFHIKMTLFVLVLGLEIFPMMTFIKWRKTQKQITEADYPLLTKLRKINHIEALIIFVIPLIAVIMVRGGFR